MASANQGSDVTIPIAIGSSAMFNFRFLISIGLLGGIIPANTAPNTAPNPQSGQG